MSEINVDGAEVQRDVTLRRADRAPRRDDERVHLPATLREDLLLEIRRLAAERRFDYLLIESTGISEPLPIAETFTFLDEMGSSLSDVARARHHGHRRRCRPLPRRLTDRRRGA